MKSQAPTLASEAVAGPKATPMVQQYMAAKAQVPDAILFFRMGDFYEMFFEDAVTASRALEITLTSRNKNDPDPVPMCGIPWHAADAYVARLIAQGFKVAICDQVEDPAEAKGLVKREVTRVVTPGMVTDPAYLSPTDPNWTLAASRSGKKWGGALLDISTGVFRVFEAKTPAALCDEILRIGPREVLLPETFKEDPEAAPLLESLASSTLSWADPRTFEAKAARQRLTDRFGTQSLAGFGVEGMKAGAGAAGALLAYVAETQKREVTHVTALTPYFLDRHLWLGESGVRNLELFKNLADGSRNGSLLSVIDTTRTSMGARLLRQWMAYPLLDTDEINARLDAVEEAKGRAGGRAALREALESVYDLERLRGRLAMGQANARDLLALGTSLEKLPALWERLKTFQSPLFSGGPVNDDLADVASLISESIAEDPPPSLRDGGIIRPGHSAELDELVRMDKDAQGAIAALETKEKAATGIGSLKIKYNRVFGYFIEVPKAHSEKVPFGYVRKQTLVNAERYITEELKEFEDRVLGAGERRVALEFSLFCAVRERLLAEDARLEEAAAFLARTDVLLALAETAANHRYCRPEVDDGGIVEIEDGRHPVVERMLAGQRYVPNSILLDDTQNQVLIITGPNMAGKSTVLRQVALTVILAQLGSFVPAARARVGLVDKIFTRVGALDNLSQGQSTFMVEMQETANILNNATPRSLVILDEIGRGTSTFDGMSIAWAVAEHLHNLSRRGVKTLFATHYHELTELADIHPRIQNFNIAVREWNDKIIFLRKLVPGGTNKSYGIAVARLAGVPEAVVGRAREVLESIENSEQIRTTAFAPDKPREKESGVQLSLFPTPADQAAKALLSMDLTAMTPIEAMNFLYEIQQKLSAKNKAGGDG